jgi:predicted DNA-binding protein (MmcQ/YjbR family)
MQASPAFHMNKETPASKWNGHICWHTSPEESIRNLLLRNEYLAAENCIPRAKIKGRLQLSEGEKSTLAEIAHRLGR